MDRTPSNGRYKTHLQSVFYHNTFSGVVYDDLDFNYGSGVSLARGCGVTLHGQFWYFGGNLNTGYERKVNIDAYIFQTEISLKASKVVGCEMIRQPFDLPYSFYSGSCNTFNVPDEKVLMCFSSDSRKSCHL